MSGYPNMQESYYGAGYGYAFDDGSALVNEGSDHTHFIVWLIVIALAAVAVLGGLKVYGFHFVVRT